MDNLKVGQKVFDKDKEGVIQYIRGGGIEIDFTNEPYTKFYSWAAVETTLSSTPYELKVVKEGFTKL